MGENFARIWFVLLSVKSLASNIDKDPYAQSVTSEPSVPRPSGRYGLLPRMSLLFVYSMIKSVKRYSSKLVDILRMLQYMKFERVCRLEANMAYRAGKGDISQVSPRTCWFLLRPILSFLPQFTKSLVSLQTAIGRISFVASGTNKLKYV